MNGHGTLQLARLQHQLQVARNDHFGLFMTFLFVSIRFHGFWRLPGPHHLSSIA